MIDEVDTATNNQVFLDFLAQLRDGYIARDTKGTPAFRSVILAGVTDIKNLKRKIRPEDTHKFNSPWNIAAEIRQHTSGYPFLVSRICQIIDTQLVGERFDSLSDAWTMEGVSEAVRRILIEKNTLFDSLMGKVYDNEEMSGMIERILFGGEVVAYNPDNLAIADAEMYGFVCNEDGTVTIANRIFETRLYNYFLSNAKLQMSPLFQYGANHKEMFVRDGKLQMDQLLEQYMVVFHDLYGDGEEVFDEAEGRRRFLLYVRPIINGTGNYYVEPQTRNNRRMDLVIDYLGERHVIELKIWRGKEYHEAGERQLCDYLDYCHLKKGYMLTYNFNQKKETTKRTVVVDGKELIEVMV